jgi:aminopeptidase N
VAAATVALLSACTGDSPTAPGPAASGPTTAAPAASTPGPAASWDAARSTPTADPVYPGYGNPDIDVLSYQLDIGWNPSTKELSGRADLQLRAVKDLSEVKLDFSDAYAIDGVELKGKPGTGTVRGTKLTVPGQVARDEVAGLIVKYHGQPKNVPMPSHRSDSEPLGLTITADGGLWTMQEPYGASTWYPSNDQPSDKAFFGVEVAVPEGWSGIATGTPRPRDATSTFGYRTTVPVATYLTTLAVGKYTKEEVAGPHGLPIALWYRKGADDKALPYLRRSPQYLQWLEQRFGPYPFESAGVLMVPSASGMETQGMITMGLPQYGSDAAFKSGFDADLLHEYAHQWFGDAVTTSNWNDLWLNEGWAQYAQTLYTLERDKQQMADWEKWARDTDGRLRQRLGPPGKPRADSFAESNVYTCPALMLHQIHKQLGDQAFFALGADWVREKRGTAQDRASFIAFVNQHTGKDFTKLINDWLDAPATPAT